MRLSDDLSCAELVRLVTDYVDGALSPEDRRRFEEHVVFCDGCSAHLEQMRTTIAVVGRVGEGELSTPAVNELIAAFRGWKRP
jgi:anti-sigma factor RsiW